MARDRFSTRLDVAAILDTVEREFWDQTHASDELRGKLLRAELSLLNVYGSGGFEANSATTRDENIIGSLVVVFPTAHTGGALTFEQDGLISKFDFAAQFVDTGLAPILPYAAFRNDAQFIMDPVRTGYRVSLTYNLFLTDRKMLSTSRITPANEQSFENMLRTLLLDSAFLPAGGLLAAGLTNKYPMPTPRPTRPANQYDPTTGQPVKPPSQIAPIRELLRGHEARILTLAQNVGLETHVKLLDDVADLFGGEINESGDWDDLLTACQVVQQDAVVLLRGEDRLEHLRQEAYLLWQEARLISIFGHVNVSHVKDGSDHVDPTTGVSVHWLSELTQLNRVQGEYVGSEGMIEHMFGDAVLVVVVPAFGEGVRRTVC
ncbi:hypothetical protein GGX14DRAFT_632537 [Mycena pura]|uniref:Uncharacterized protein n=1 Tax=Mycena pura TaxID=153505 RepID=A0AAD6Y9W5_9AGAR|nr:hypothetical protein GGX14DRAFT_632537 [Mycena pura]